VYDHDTWALKGRYSKALRNITGITWGQGENDRPIIVVAEDDRSAFSTTSTTAPSTTTTTPTIETPPPDPSDSTTTYRNQVAALLNIPASLRERPQAVDLRFAYLKYQGYLEAKSTLYRMIKDGSWTIGPVTGTELVEIFVSNSVWHANYTKLFPKLNDHPDVLKWLKNTDDAPSGFDIFGVERHMYTFKDLRKLLDAREVGVGMKGKRKLGVGSSIEKGGSRKKPSGKGKERAM
jgi:hypothetical protein